MIRNKLNCYTYKLIFFIKSITDASLKSRLRANKKLYIFPDQYYNFNILGRRLYNGKVKRKKGMESEAAGRDVWHA